MTDCMPAAGKSTRDPFNWPAQNRKDLMSLSTLDPSRDIVHTRTGPFRDRLRDSSSNMATHDIFGKKSSE